MRLYVMAGRGLGSLLGGNEWLDVSWGLPRP